MTHATVSEQAKLAGHHLRIAAEDGETLLRLTQTVGLTEILCYLAAVCVDECDKDISPIASLAWASDGEALLHAAALICSDENETKSEMVGNLARENGILVIDTPIPERSEEIPNEPRCDCGHFFEICNFPNCACGSQIG